MSQPHQPLVGRRVVITRASHQSQALSQALQAAGAAVISAPAIAIVPPSDGGQPLDDALLRLDRFSWVAFSSTNAVAATFARAGRRGVRSRLAQVKVAAIGPATAERLSTEIDRPPDLVATAHTSEDHTDESHTDTAHTSEGHTDAAHTAAGLAQQFPAPSPTDHCFVPMAQHGRPDLVAGLRARGWNVSAVAAYRTVQPDLAPGQLSEVVSADAVVFASPSALTGHLAQLAKHDRTLSPTALVVCIGSTTAQACSELGITPAAVASAPTPAHLVEAVCVAVASGV